VARPCALALGAALVWLATPVGAAKWHRCPDQLGYYPSATGALTSPFAHPGHPLGISLLSRDVESTGGFSTAVDGNVVHVTFASLFGSPIELPPFTATAVSAATLYFDFPDANQVVGRQLAGPVAITVTNGAQTVADIRPRDLTALPHPADVGAILTGTSEQGALATMDTRGSIWIPVQFAGFGTVQMAMPSCPMALTPITALSVGVTVRATPSFYVGAPPSYPPFRVVRRVDLFLGDMLVNGTNFYGMQLGTVPVFRVPRGWGMKVCAVNDTVDLVLRAPGRARWAKPWSAFGTWMPDSTPLDIVIDHMSADPVVTGTPVDAFGQECLLQ